MLEGCTTFIIEAWTAEASWTLTSALGFTSSIAYSKQRQSAIGRSTGAGTMLPLNVMDLLKRNRSSRGVAANHYLTKVVLGKVAPDREKGLCSSVRLPPRWQHRETVASHVKACSIVALSLLFFFTLPICGQVATNTPANIESRRIKNIAPEAMWKRVTACAFPTYSPLARQVHITGTVDIALLVAPEGTLANYRVLVSSPLLVASAVDAIRQWKFQPDVVDGDMVWTRVRAVVFFNADGTTAVELARALLPDNFGDPGTTGSEEGRLSRPASAPECKSVQSFTGPQASEVEANEVSLGFYKNNYFGLTFHFPSDWQVADRETLNLIAANGAKAAQAQFGPMPANVHMLALPSYLLFFARTDGPIGSAGPSVHIWAEKEPFIISAEQYFPNSRFLADKTADGTRGPTAVEVNGTKYYRADRWGKVDDHSIYQVRLVTYTRDLILAIDVEADTAAIAEQLVMTLEGLRSTPVQPKSQNQPELGTLCRTEPQQRIQNSCRVVAMASVSVAQQPDGNQPGGESAVVRAGVNGITPPRCIHCPQPQYSKEAFKARVSGVVLLDVTVTSEGKVINSVLVKGPGSGLNEKALEQVRKWKMSPALNPAGKPVNCRVQIEITFHRSRGFNSIP
jgi:TonB family protein